jgi:integrase
MARPRSKAPQRTYHISGQSVVRIGNRDIYLGQHDSPESIARYAVLIGIYQANGLTLPEDFDASTLDRQAAALLGQLSPQAAASDQAALPITVKHITAGYRDHIATKYANTPQEHHRHSRLCDQLDEKFGDVEATEFGPVRLKAFRDDRVAEGLARKYVNRLVNCVVAIFRHSVASELIGIATVERLKTLEPLRYGQTAAHETAAVEPVDIEHVRRTAAYLTPVVKAMLRVQIATGARPKEVCMMRPRDIDRSGKVWLYRPSSHKTTHAGRSKTIPLVDDAREAVTDFLNRDPDAFLFSPAESMAWRRAVGAANRKTAMNCGNRAGSNRKADPQRLPRDRYDAQSYRQSIQRAAKAAGVPQWHPYQCRHLTATMIRAALNIEDTQALLGHSKAAMTAHYARESLEAATRAAGRSKTLAWS